MFKLTIKMMQSLDGFIAKFQNDKLQWGSSADKQLYKKISTEFGTVIIGKNTYLQMPKIAFKNRKIIVLVRDLNIFLTEQRLPELEIIELENIKLVIQDNITFIQSNPLTIIQYLESIDINKALLVGGGIINNLFLQANLVSELQVTIAPKILGSGIKIFGNNHIDQNLELKSFEKISDNELLIIYKVINQKLEEKVL